MVAGDVLSGEQRELRAKSLRVPTLGRRVLGNSEGVREPESFQKASNAAEGSSSWRPRRIPWM